MKETTLEQFENDPQGVLQASQRERVLVTAQGKPVAVVVGLENKDREDLALETSEDFWQMIEERRQRPTVPLRDIEAELFADESSPVDRS